MAGNSWQPSTNVLIGRWRTVGMDLWEQEDIDLVAPGSSSSARTTSAASGSSPSQEGPTGERVAGPLSDT